MTRLLWLALVASACGSTTAADGNGSAMLGSGAPSAAQAVAAPVADIAATPFGLAELDGFHWRGRGGAAAFRAARKAESRGDWAGVAASSAKALALDPTNLEASWLLAAADGALGKDAEVLVPLQLAVAGDFGKWADASLELPELQEWLATPTGQAWRRRVDADRAGYAAALARSTIVAAGGDLYAFDATDHGRWYRLTRTYGGVMAALALPESHRVAYVTRLRHAGTHAVGLVDLSTGHATRAQPVDAPAFAIQPRTAGGAWVRAGRRAAGSAAMQLGEDGKLAAVTRPEKADAAAGPALIVLGASAALDRRAAGITADFDDRGLASQIRLDTSKRVVSVPSPGQIDGSSIAWSPDRAQLAMIAQLEDRCMAGARAAVAVFVVDAATGVMRSIERATGGLAVEWLADGRLAVAGDHGVSIYDVDQPGATALAIPGATDLVTPRRVPRCVKDEAPEPSTGSAGSDDVDLE